MEYLIDCLLGIIGSLFAAEAFAWFPELAQKIVERAVKRSPEAKQERLREEWLAHLDECPWAFWKSVSRHRLLVWCGQNV
jgi:hypothetical protein